MSAQRVVFEIVQGQDDWGSIVLELDADKAPQTVENFLNYVDDGFLDGTIFHRVISTFMIQGGGYSAPDRPKRDGLREAVVNEAANDLKNSVGTIAMARTSDPHSATSQFFINVADNEMLDYPGSDGWGYCVFGRVVEGMDVVDKIKSVDVAVNPMSGERSAPKNPPAIKRAVRA